MSDGGGETGREHPKPNTQRKLGGDEYAQAIAKIAVAQICEKEGFQTFQPSALETLSDIAVRYTRNIGKAAHDYANLAGRTECNVFDIIQGLEDMGLPQGFSGASDVDHCLACSGTVREIIQYVGQSDDVPFAYAIPQFPVVKDRNLTPSFLQVGKEPPEDHIPAWLPVFPEPHTYAPLPTPDVKAMEPMVKMEQKKHRKVDRSLLNLRQQFVCNGLDGLSSEDTRDADKGKQAGEGNPYLAAPMQYGEKEVSRVFLPAKLSNEATVENPVSSSQVMGNHVSVLATFAPAIDAMQGRLLDSEQGQKNVLLNRSNTVQFKIGTGKKSLNTMPHLSPRNTGFEMISPSFGMEGDKDEKKRRAEKILKESMENPQGLAQL